MATEQLLGFDRLGRIQDAIKMWQAVQPVLDGEPPLDAPGAIEARIDEVFVAGRQIVLLTDTDTDNNILASADKAWSDPTVKLVISGIVKWGLEYLKPGDPVRMPVIDREQLSIPGVDIEAITTFVTILLQVVAWFKGRKKPA